MNQFKSKSFLLFLKFSVHIHIILFILQMDRLWVSCWDSVYIKEQDFIFNIMDCTIEFHYLLVLYKFKPTIEVLFDKNNFYLRSIWENITLRIKNIT